MRLAMALSTLLIATPAFAGGIGIVGGAGMRTEPVYWYLDGEANDQYEQRQWITQGGGGIEVVLGDRDDRFMGFFRGYYWQEGPETDPALLTTIPEGDQEVVANWRTDPRNVGMFTVGIQYAPIGNPQGVSGLIVADIGSGFLTVDHTEFLQVEGGIGAQWMMVRGLQSFVNVVYTARWRKGFRQGPHAYAGIRYLFD